MCWQSLTSNVSPLRVSDEEFGDPFIPGAWIDSLETALPVSPDIVMPESQHDVPPEESPSVLNSTPAQQPEQDPPLELQPEPGESPLASPSRSSPEHQPVESPVASASPPAPQPEKSPLAPIPSPKSQREESPLASDSLPKPPLEESTVAPETPHEPQTEESGLASGPPPEPQVSMPSVPERVMHLADEALSNYSALQDMFSKLIAGADEDSTSSQRLDKAEGEIEVEVNFTAEPVRIFVFTDS